jgi:DNA-binding NtrC family response regulator/predicted hydrocarbon binding protein
MTAYRSGALTLIAESIDDQALSNQLHFRPDAGQIELFDQRMLLMHGFSVAALRRELIERLGLDRSRELMTRLGYQQGLKDAECLRQGPEADLSRLMAQGPRLREIEGFVRNQAVERMQYNTESGEFWGDYLWRASWEAEAHLHHLGTSGTPACWMMTGYACGFTTAMMGRPILWRELECVAMGHACCRVIGRPLEEYEDAEEDLRFLQIEDFVAAPRGRQSSAPASAASSAQPSAVPATALGEDVVGASPGFNAVIHLIKRVAPTDATVLLNGESGVGKERFAKMLHRIGPRAERALISVNCAAIPAELVESELFGVEKGAYTGATASRPGRFERADGGTLFLDEVSSLPLHAQGKLLRVLQEQELERVGDTRLRRVNVRIIAAANRDLRAAVHAGAFREDLYFRLNVFPIEIPPLRARRDDIPLLVNLFLEQSARRFHKRIAGMSRRAHEALWAYDWPGNVRELQNAVERAVILADDGGSLDVQHFSASLQSGLTWSGATSAKASQAPRAPEAVAQAEGALDTRIEEFLQACGSLEGVEQRFMDHALRKTQGNVSAAARLLGLRRGQLEYRVGKHPRD